MLNERRSRHPGVSGAKVRAVGDHKAIPRRPDLTDGYLFDLQGIYHIANRTYHLELQREPCLLGGIPGNLLQPCHSPSAVLCLLLAQLALLLKSPRTHLLT